MPNDVDISSYKTDPGPAPIDIANKLGAAVQQQQNIQRGDIAISADQLKLMNERWGFIHKDLTTLLSDPEVANGGPNALNKVKTTLGNHVKMGFIPPEMADQFIKTLPTDSKKVPQAIYQSILRGQDINSAINTHYGQPGEVVNQQTIQPVTRSAIHGTRATQPPIQIQNPPSATVLDPGGRPALLGPQAPQLAPDSVAAPPMRPDLVNRLPVAPPQSPANATTTGPYNQKVLPKDQSRVVDPNAPMRPNMVTTVPYGPKGPVTGFAPGVAEAENVAGGASGKALADSRTRAGGYQRDIFPLVQAIPALEKLGTKGTGPGTETINNIKSFVISNVPGVTADAFDGSVKDFDKAKKYMVDFVNQTGNSGTNDKLAAAFAGNPSVGISNAAAVDVAKSALALRKMQQALHLEFEQSGLPSNKFSSWMAKRSSDVDPRAFGVDMMTKEAKQKLYKQLDKNATEGKRFDDSLQLAHDLGVITPGK